MFVLLIVGMCDEVILFVCVWEMVVVFVRRNYGCGVVVREFDKIYKMILIVDEVKVLMEFWLCRFMFFGV